RQATVVPNGERYLRPATTIQALLGTFRSHAAQTTARLRVVGSVLDPPWTAWGPWARYEAAVNDIFADFPVWGLCLYDTRKVSDEVLDEVERTHAYIQRPGEESVHSSKFEPASTFLGHREPPRPDPIESTTPHTELVNPTAAQARHAVVEAGAGSKLAADTIADLILGVSEVVANAHLHGAAPVNLRIWSSHDRIVATVHDCGEGPADPLAGLLPAQPIGEGGGLGLWVAHQICSEVIHNKSPNDFTVRLVVQ
ncbi:MAG: sensor histidine kinase, partial [Actinobacteria bacterium]|nr:sensor histidine kinase [Actinomycetota bacterium]